MASDLIGYLIEFAAHFVLLTVALWIMLKLQKLDYNFPALLGSAVLGGGLDMIPHFGHLLAVPVLYFCIWKMTRASMFPDAAFTVVIAYALMFAFNMLMLTALIGDLRPDLRADNQSQSATDHGTNLEETTILGTNTSPPGTNAAVISKNAALAAKDLTVKGVTRNGANSSVSIKAGTKTYFVGMDQATLITTDDGILSVRLAALGDSKLTLEVGGEPVALPLP